MMKTSFHFSILVILLAACASARAAEYWKPLWDGKTFAGWHVIGKGDWKIIDGAIRGTHDKTEKEFGHLVTDKVYRDFTARLKYKAVKGNEERGIERRPGPARRQVRSPGPRRPGLRSVVQGHPDSGVIQLEY